MSRRWKWAVASVAILVASGVAAEGVAWATHRTASVVSRQFNPFGDVRTVPTGTYPNAKAFCRGLPPAGLDGLVTEAQKEDNSITSLLSIGAEVVTAPTPQVHSEMSSLYKQVVSRNYGSDATKSVVSSVSAQLPQLCSL